MIFEGREVAFPAVMQISFFKLFEQLELMVKDKDRQIADYAKALLKEMEPYPELRDGFSDTAKIKKYKKQIKKLCRTLFPDALVTNEIKALTPPFYFEPIYTSTRFDQIVKSSGQDFSLQFDGIDEDTFYLYACYFILGSYFKYPVHAGGHLKVRLYNKEQKIYRTYKIAINADMMEFVPGPNAVNITRDDFEELVDNFGDINVWKKKFPPNSWTMRGISIMNLMDITIDDSIASITSNLLIKSPETFENVRNGMRNLFSNPKLKMGVTTYANNNLSRIKEDEIPSIALGTHPEMHCNETMCDHTYAQLIVKREALVIPDVAAFHKKSQSSFSKHLNTLEIKSYLMVPLVHEDELQGFMELASDNAYELNSVSVSRLKEVLPVLAMAHKRFKTEAQNQIEAIIQQECTTIHPSVKWRFEEEAKKFLAKKINNENPVFTDIVFKNLYPLYGQMDIKGSSAKRNEAVSSDLFRQLTEVKKVLSSALKFTKMPVYDELIFRINKYLNELQDGLTAGGEHKILAFLRSEIDPVFKHLKKRGPNLARVVEKYEALLDPELDTIYEERRKFDHSVNLINQHLASFIDDKQIDAQLMFPHYFERYKTDGVEYNLYIGQSITGEQDFNPIYLKNLRIWQLLATCEMEREFKSMQKKLDVHLEMTSLILVYSTPLSVHFRMDEKRFDVEGAYNARYEIIKKRVDKALIKGTNNRITVPGHIAIIYSQDQDAIEYRTYLNYLVDKGYLKSRIEDHELEDLQGISGLRALRVEIAYRKRKKPVGVEELIEAIESGSEN